MGVLLLLGGAEERGAVRSSEEGRVPVVVVVCVCVCVCGGVYMRMCGVG